MGLFACPDCGSQVSTNAKACPKCGCSNFSAASLQEYYDWNAKLERSCLMPVGCAGIATGVMYYLGSLLVEKIGIEKTMAVNIGNILSPIFFIFVFILCLKLLQNHKY